MLADEVTHVKMGTDWLRRITATDPERQKNALEFQKAVDKLFSFGGFRGEHDENPVHLARNFRRLAGFTDDEIAELVDIAAEAYAEAQAQQTANAAAVTAGTDRGTQGSIPLTALWVLDFHETWAWFVIIGNGLAGVWALAAHRWPALRTRALWWFIAVVEVTVFVQVILGVILVSQDKLEAPQFHTFYGFVGDHRRRRSSTRTAIQMQPPPVPAVRLRQPVRHGPRHPSDAGRLGSLAAGSVPQRASGVGEALLERVERPWQVGGQLARRTGRSGPGSGGWRAIQPSLSTASSVVEVVVAHRRAR